MFFSSLSRLLKRHGLIDELDLMHLNGERHYLRAQVGSFHIRFHILVAQPEVGGYCTDCRRWIRIAGSTVIVPKGHVS